jgi:hypothetical protein
MRRWNLSHYAMSSCVTAALLAGCGGGGESATPSAYQAAQALKQSRTFNYTGGKQSFVVPAGVTRITVVARGAHGVGCPRTGRGARVYAELPVTPKERLDIYVGGSGKGTGLGGFNGGGSSDIGVGGGASDVRVSPGGLRDRILVAGGGGGASETYYGCAYGVDWGTGGGGGGLTGESGIEGGPYYDLTGGQGGSGGTQTQGGAGGDGGTASSCSIPGNPGAAGALGLGGSGANPTASQSYFGSAGGGGGGGYFGGGGGGSACLPSYSSGGGGGGGSSYAEPRATNVRYWGNWKNATAHGLVVISW